ELRSPTLDLREQLLLEHKAEREAVQARNDDTLCPPVADRLKGVTQPEARFETRRRGLAFVRIRPDEVVASFACPGFDHVELHAPAEDVGNRTVERHPDVSDDVHTSTFPLHQPT